MRRVLQSTVAALENEAQTHAKMKQRHQSLQAQSERSVQRELRLQQRVDDLQGTCASTQRDLEDQELETHLCRRDLQQAQAEVARLQEQVQELKGEGDSNDLEAVVVRVGQTAAALKRGSTFSDRARAWHCSAVEVMSVGVQVRSHAQCVHSRSMTCDWRNCDRGACGAMVRSQDAVVSHGWSHMTAPGGRSCHLQQVRAHYVSEWSSALWQ